MIDNTVLYVINLDKSKKRLTNFRKAFDPLDLNIEKVPAIDGRYLDIETYSNDSDCQKEMGRGIQPGEIGCFLSHKKALEKFLATDSKYAIVFEDDAIPRDGFKDTVDALILKFLQNNEKVAAVNLGALDFKYSSKVLVINNNVLRCAHRFPMLATAVLWTRPGAKTFLNNASLITMPYDNFLRVLFTGTNSVFSIQPPIIRSSGIESDIAARNQNVRRSALNRSSFYFLIKQRRIIRDKLSAIKGFLNWFATK